MLHKIKTALQIIKTYNNWPGWFLHHFGLPALSTLTTIKVAGSQLLIPNTAEGWGVADQIWREKVYTKHFPIHDGDRVLDVGGHFGIFAVFAATQGKGVKVISYEPSKESFGFLEKNIQINSRIDQITAFNVGLSERSGNFKLYRAKGNNASSSLFKENIALVADIVEESVVLEEANQIWSISEEFDFAKFDCEGAEFAIFRRLGKNLRRFRFVVLEYHGNAKEIIDLLNIHGFSIIEICPLLSPPCSAIPLGMLYARRIDLGSARR